MTEEKMREALVKIRDLTGVRGLDPMKREIWGIAHHALIPRPSTKQDAKGEVSRSQTAAPLPDATQAPTASDRLRKMAALVLKDYQNAMDCPVTSPVYAHMWGTYRDAAAMYAHEMAALLSQEGLVAGADGRRGMSTIEVRTSYDMSNFPAFDAAVNAAAGRPSNFSGAGMGRRDLGWVCASEIEAAQIARDIKKIGLQPNVVVRADGKGGKP